MEFEKEVKHISIFHEEFFISSTMNIKDAQIIYSYLVGSNEAQREERQLKCFGYSEVSRNTSTIFKNKQAEESKILEGQPPQSDFCRTNSQHSFTFVNRVIHGFVIGPHNLNETEQSMKFFAPVVHFKDENGQDVQYRILVYIGHKTLLILKFEVDFVFTYDFLSRLDSHLTKHVAVISNLIDQSVNKALQPDDPCKFFYYNEGNMAVKVSNLVTKDIFNYELKLQLNQMHEAFKDDEDL